jgi:hypothetical protein
MEQTVTSPNGSNTEVSRSADAEPGISAAPFPDAPPAFAIRAALGLRYALHWLADRVVPAEVATFDFAAGIARTQIVTLLARHGIPDMLAEEPLTSEEIARRKGLHPDALHRVLRALATLGVLRLRKDGRFENGRIAEALRSGRPSRARQWARYFGSRSNCEAWLDLEESVKTGKSAFPRVHGTSVWEWFDRHPEEREDFAQAMMGMTLADAPVVAKLYPFSEISSVCDVGGGRGTLLSEILVRHPHLRGALYDGAGVIASARSLLAARGVSGRVETCTGSFFDKVPSGYDAYLLKNILHDWDDARSLTILENCRRAMSPGNRVLVIEMLVEKNDTSGIGPLSDVQMLVVCDDGKERGREELRALLERAGFEMRRVFPSPTVSVVEGIAV